MRPLTSGSAMERADKCPPSVALPHAHYISIDSDRGSVLHKFLEDHQNAGPEAALEATPHEWKKAAAAMDLTGLEDLLSTPGGAEIAIAVNVRTMTARELGRGVGRLYTDVTEDEIPCTLDVVRLRGKRGLLVDWKTGFGRALAEWQLRFGALAIALLWDLEIVEYQQINVAIGAPFIRRGTLGPMDLEIIKAEVTDVFERALAARREYEVGRPITEFAIGDWCDYCPAKLFCDAQTRMIRKVMTGDGFTEIPRGAPMPREMAAKVLRKIKDARKALHILEQQALGHAKNDPLYLGEDAANGHHWLVEAWDEGDEKFDGEVADVVMTGVLEELQAGLGYEAAGKAIKRTVTKAAIEEAVRASVPKGHGARTIKAIHKGIREAGGATRKWKRKMVEMITKAKEPPTPMSLPPGSIIDTEAEEK